MFTVLLTSLIAVLPAHAMTYDPSVCAGGSPVDGELSQECLEMIEAFPRPVVIQVPLDGFTLSNYSFWRVTHQSPSLYDAPGGGVLGQMPAGFNFVRAVDTSVEGWVQIESGEWMSGEDVIIRHVLPRRDRADG
jgi:hypothetical protein